MAEFNITAQVGERQDVIAVRDCANPSAEPEIRRSKAVSVLSLAFVSDVPSPDEVVVNGVRYVQEARA